LEPWAEEFFVAPQSVIEIGLNGVPDSEFEIAENSEQVTLYAPGGSTVCVSIDGTVVNANHVSYKIAAPDAGALGTKGFIDIVFGNSPEARPGGEPRKEKSWLSKLFRR
jgi:hypothetical protein